jgi:recombination protein RecA
VCFRQATDRQRVPALHYTRVPAALTSAAMRCRIPQANKKRILDCQHHYMPANLTAVRLQVESTLASRGVHAAFNYRDRRRIETVSAGFTEMDLFTGGLPRGSLTEICGPPCSGRTTLLFSALAARTADAEACALIDGRDTFDPHTAQAAGIELKQLLWVRCRDINQALRATDLLLQGGGFGLIAVDLSDLPPQTVRYVPLNAWFRFRRAVEDTPTILLLLEQEPNAKTCASLVLQLGTGTAHWATTQQHAHSAAHAMETHDWHSSASLLDGFDIHAEVLRSRIQPVSGTLTGTYSGKHVASADTRHEPANAMGDDKQTFETRIMWSCLGGTLYEPR